MLYKLNKKEKRNAIIRSITLIVLLVALIASTIFLLLFNDKRRKTHFILVGYSSSGITFVNEDVDVYIIDFSKLEENVDYKTIKSEVYYFVNESSRVYLLATYNEETLYIYNDRVYLNYYDIDTKKVIIRSNGGEKIDLRDREN